MLDLIFSALAAYNQAGMLIAAAVCGGLGFALLGNGLYWRLFGLRVDGTVLGVIEKGGTYNAIYRYVLPDGTIHEAKSDVGTGWLKGYETGRVVPILLARNDPQKARKARSFLLEATGAILLMPAYVLGHAAVAEYPLTPMTVIVALVLLAILGERAVRWLTRNGDGLSLGEWRRWGREFLATAGLARSTAPLDLSAMKSADEILAAAAAAGPNDVRNRRIATVVLAVFAVVLIGLGVTTGTKVLRLQAEGVRTEGQVVRLDEEESSGDDGGTVYVAVVRFRDAGGIAIEFRDSTGAAPPLHRRGDRVAVLYLKDAPAEAIIDSGVVWNLMMPALATVFGLAAAGLAIAMLVAKGTVPARRASPTVAASREAPLGASPDSQG